MSSRTTKRGSKLGSSRRNKNRNRETEERENDDGFQDPENNQYQNEKSQCLTVSGNQSSNESLLPHSDQPVIASTKPTTSVPEPSSQPQSQDFTDLLEQAEVTSKHRKMGSNRKKNFKFKEIYEDKPEDQVQLCEGVSDEQGLSENACVKTDEGQKFPESQYEHESSILHLAIATTVQNEDIHNNDQNQHLETILQSKHIDIISSGLNISNENSGVTPLNSNVTLHESNKSLEIYQTDTFSKPVAFLPNIPGPASQIDTTYIPFNENSDQRQAVQMSQNNLIHNDKSIEEHTVLKTMDTQFSVNVLVRDKQEDTNILDSVSTNDIRQHEVTGVLSASLITEHEQETNYGEVASLIWENVGTNANTEYDHSEQLISYELKFQSDSKITEKEVETDAKTETCNLQQNSQECVTELEAGDQMLDKAIKDTTESLDTESEVIKEKNDVKKDINSGSTESFPTEDFIDVNDVKADMTSFMDEIEMASDITNTQGYACTVQASMVVNEHYIESPTSTNIVHTYPTSDLEEQIPETEDMQVHYSITIPDQEQSTPDEFQVNPHIESEAKQCESKISIGYIQKNPPENVGFSLSEKNKIDSTLSGFKLEGNQKAIKETIQAQSLDKTSTSEAVTLSFTSETCYTQSSESLNIMEPGAEKNEENVTKTLVTNENMSTLQGQHDAAWYISTELVNTNVECTQECSVLGRQNEETLLVENIGAVLNTTHVISTNVAAHLVDTENLKMQHETELSDSVVQNEEAKTEEKKNGQITFKDAYQIAYSDLNLEHSKSLEFSGKINSDRPIPSAENLTLSELSTEKFLSHQTTSKNLSLATDHPDFKEGDEKSTENIKRSHLPLVEGKVGEDQEIKWKDLENTDKLEHQIITQPATTNLLNKLQKTTSEVTLDIYGLPVTSEQKQTRTGEIDAPPSISSVKADPIYPVVSYEIGNAGGLTDLIEQNERPRVQTEKDSKLIHLNKQVTVPVITENKCANKVNVYSTCGPVEPIPETQATLDMQKNTENFHTVLSDQNPNITEEHLENLTNMESEADQFASTSTCIQTVELKSSQVEFKEENVELFSRKRLKGQIPGSVQKNKFEVIKENENIQEQIMDQNSTKIGVIKEDTNDKKEEVNAGLTEDFTQMDITTVHSQQHVLCDSSSQNTDHGLTTIEQPSSATEHPDFMEGDRNGKKNVDNINADIHPQVKKKKKFGSTRRPYGKHQLTAEVEEGEWKDIENIEENKHQIMTQGTSLNLHTEPQITMSEVTLDNSSVTITKQQQIITTEGKTEKEIDSPPRILSAEIDQPHTVIFNAVVSAEGLTEIIEQNEKAEVNEEKNDRSLILNKLKMASVITKIQDDTFKDHVKMASDKSLDNECVNDYNIHSTHENVENRNAEIHTQTQTKKTKKFGSTRRLRGRNETPNEVVEEEWKDLKNTEKTQSLDESRFDMPVVLEHYHTKTEELQENPINTESKPDQCEITCPVVHIQELKIAPGDLATKNLGDSSKKSLSMMKEKENIQEQTTEKSTPNSEKYGAQKETLDSGTEISHQSIQMHLETLNIEDKAEKMCSTCENLEVKQNNVEAWQRTTDLAEDNNLECLQLVSKEDISNPESNFCPTSTIRQENQSHIHHKLDQSADFVHTEIELHPNKSLKRMVNTPAVNPDILEMPESKLPSFQNSQIHIEPSSQARRRKMGSSRKISKNKNANVTNDEPTIDGRIVEDTVIAERTEDMEVCVKLSQINESSAQHTEQLLEGRQKFGSRCTTQESSGSTANKDGEYERKKDIQVTEGEIKVSDTGYISETESALISPAVSKPRPGMEEVGKTISTNSESTEGSIVSLESIRKTMPSAISTGERQIIDFEQLPDFGQAVYNVVMVGNSNVGKTSFIKRLQSGHFTQDYSATIGVDTFVHTVTFGNRTVKLYVWDTAGQERYHSITRQVFHKAHGLLLMYDITSSQSFHAVRDWISQVQENAAPDVILMLLGNKNDCANREVLLQDGEHLSNEYNIHFMECSAATGENLSESLKTLAWLLVRQKMRKEDKHTTLQPQPQNKKFGCC